MEESGNANNVQLIRNLPLGASRPTAKGGDAVTVASVLPGRIPLDVPGLTLAPYRQHEHRINLGHIAIQGHIPM